VPSTSFCFFFLSTGFTRLCCNDYTVSLILFCLDIFVATRQSYVKHLSCFYILNEIGTQQIDPVVGVSSGILAADTLDDIVSCPLLKMARA